MWWEPTSDWERVLAEDVRELRRWKFEDPIASEIGCFGIGSIWSEYDEGLVPFVLVSREIRAWTWEGTFQRMRNGWLLRLIRPAFPAIPRLRLPLYFAVLKEPRPTNTATATQIAADRLIDTFVRVREPIGPDIKATGTAGVIAWTKHKMPVVLTAGHVFPNGVGSEAFRFHSRWPHLRWLRPPERSSIGAVWKHMVPKSGGPGWDVAVILSDPVISTLVEAPLVARQYKRFQRPRRSGFMARTPGWLQEQSCKVPSLTLVHGRTVGW
jgi:hypothetical protein